MPINLPKPTPDGDSGPFWEAARRGELLIQQCRACQAYIFYPRSICPHCFSADIAWVVSSGRGRIYSYTVVHRAFGPFAEETPYVVAIIQLEEGVRMMSRVLGDRADIAIDRPVEVVFREMDDGEWTLPYFQLTTGS